MSNLDKTTVEIVNRDPRCNPIQFAGLGLPTFVVRQSNPIQGGRSNMQQKPNNNNLPCKSTDDGIKQLKRKID